MAPTPTVVPQTSRPGTSLEVVLQIHREAEAFPVVVVGVAVLVVHPVPAVRPVPVAPRGDPQIVMVKTPIAIFGKAKRRDA